MVFDILHASAREIVSSVPYKQRQPIGLSGGPFRIYDQPETFLERNVVERYVSLLAAEGFCHNT
jgi:hypothetical protein